MSSGQNSPGHSYVRVFGYLVIAAVVMAIPMGVRAGFATYECYQLQPLFRLAVERGSGQSEKLGQGSLSPIPFTSKVVNGPRVEDARIEFSAQSGKGYARVIARGRLESGEWCLTYLEIQPTSAGWLVDGPIGGYKHLGKLTPLKD